jgi:two-component system sensor histidine kinase KdpD
VLLVSIYWGLGLGLATGLASALAFNFFHIPPTGRFTIGDEQNWVALAVYFVAAAVTSTLAGSARRRAEEAERRREEADLNAEMARVLLGAADLEDSLRVVGQRIAAAFGLAWVEVEMTWTYSDERRRALPVVVDGVRAGTVAVPRDAPEQVVGEVEGRVIPSLETLLTAARQREGLEAQVIETRALRRSNVVKTALLRSVSHDLRSPLTAITTAADGLTSTTLDDDSRRELVAIIAEEAERLTKLVDNLLDLSRLQAGQLESRADSLSAEDVIGGALSSVKAPPGGFEVAIEPDLPLLRADPAHLERALVNVLENAARYAGTEPVRVSGQSAGRDVSIRVTDRGPGVAQADLERIFEPFQGSAERGGAGLGLAIARGFVEAGGGRITAHSLPGQGATFMLRLPAAAEASDSNREGA